MSVEIDPSELGFRRPFTVEVAQVLKIRNPNSSPVAFKVKTTAPKQYCVRPNSGRIEPGHEVEVSVLLQAMKQEPAPDARCRDKFLVQSVAIAGDQEFNNIQQIWDGVEKSAIQERKIRVTWLPPQEEGRTEAVSTPARRSLGNVVEDTPISAPPPAYSSPDTTAQFESTPAPQTEPRIKSEDIDDVQAPALSLPGPSTVSSIKATVADDYETIKSQLAEAKATIAKLTTEATSGLRQRKAAASTEEEAPAKQPELTQATRQGIEGVSVKIVAVLCLVSFLLGYFFF
ncbi:vesicle-associated protein 2-2 [Podospora fimiseda]|uniref:Vesicle-associated protein 2-2 n=1 Tax=Podospora fimiseda TaxID=252190 RepID=A0AAN7GXB3_9PEZI|nr:vesicle-associated protein 2-2 [Podospora fimiseda]